MKNVLIIVAVALLCLSVLAAAEDDQPVDKSAVRGDVKTEVKAVVDKATPVKELTLAKYLIGEWILTPTKYRVSGDFTFRADGTYERNEMHPKDGGLGAKGEYRLYADQKPCGIDLCLDKCGGEGSEWTTMLGIVRKLDDGRVELQFSPDGKRLKEFAKDPDPMYTFQLTRKTAKAAEPKK